MALPLQPSPEDDYRIPVRYTEAEIQFLRAAWHLTNQQVALLQPLLHWRVPKEIAREMALATKTIRNMIDDIRESAKLQDGADGIRQGAAELIARYRADPEMSPYEDEEYS